MSESRSETPDPDGAFRALGLTEQLQYYQHTHGVCAPTMVAAAGSSSSPAMPPGPTHLPPVSTFPPPASTTTSTTYEKDLPAVGASPMAPSGLLASPGLLAPSGQLAPLSPLADVSSMTDAQLASYTASLIGEMPEPLPVPSTPASSRLSQGSCGSAAPGSSEFSLVYAPGASPLESSGETCGSNGLLSGSTPTPHQGLPTPPFALPPDPGLPAGLPASSPVSSCPAVASAATAAQPLHAGQIGDYLSISGATVFPPIQAAVMASPAAPLPASLVDAMAAMGLPASSPAVSRPMVESLGALHLAPTSGGDDVPPEGTGAAAAPPSRTITANDGATTPPTLSAGGMAALSSACCQKKKLERGRSMAWASRVRKRPRGPARACSGLSLAAGCPKPAVRVR